MLCLPLNSLNSKNGESPVFGIVQIPVCKYRRHKSNAKWRLRHALLLCSSLVSRGIPAPILSDRDESGTSGFLLVNYAPDRSSRVAELTGRTCRPSEQRTMMTPAVVSAWPSTWVSTAELSANGRKRGSRRQVQLQLRSSCTRPRW